MRSDRLAEKTRRAAAFNTDCSRSCSWHDIPARTELFVKLIGQSGIHVKAFADDMKVYIELSDVQFTVKLQDVLNLIDMWAADWQLQISVTKTNILNIGSTEHAVDYYMGNTVLPVVTTCRDLGITVTNDLAPSQHQDLSFLFIAEYDKVVLYHRCCSQFILMIY